MIGAVDAFIGVALGAFGAHALRAYLEKLPDGAKRAEWWETASRYHLIHALAIAVAAYLAARAPGGASTAAGYCFAGGILLFSGSLYTMTLTGIRVLGAVTPFGGLLMMAGWIAVVIAALQMGK